MILKIRQTGDPALRRHCRPLSADEIQSAAIQELMVAMRETMRDAPGVGLAAPQVGISIQLAVIEDRQEYIDKLPPAIVAERGRRAIPFQVIVNPILTAIGEGMATFHEGCLSLAGFTAQVSRPYAVRVECLNEKMESVVIDAQGWYARILQHEIDHLHGKMYIDRMKSETFMTLDNHTRLNAPRKD